MMDCSRCRSALLANPHDDRAEVLEHVKSCRECALYSQRLQVFEGRLDRALRVPLPARAAGGESAGPASAGAAPAHVAPAAAIAASAGAARSVRRRPRRGVLAAAASVLLGFAFAGGLWLGAPGRSLASDVVGHMAEEPAAWSTDRAVPPAGLDRVFAASHLALKGDAGLVSYANSCEFRGHLVPHLVVQTDVGPVTVMVLTEESVRGSVRFDEHGYRGIILPVPGHGSIAVLERGTAVDGKTLQAVAQRVAGALDWRSASAPPTAAL